MAPETMGASLAELALALPRARRRRCQRLSRYAATLVVLGSVRVCVAQSLPHLVVHRSDDSADCPDAPALAALVERQTKRAAVEPSDERHPPAVGTPVIDVQITRSDTGYTAIVQAGDKTRQISDDGSTCAGLSEALAITLAILLDKELPAAPPPPPLPPKEEPPPRPAIVRIEPPPPQPAKRFLGLGAGAAAVTSDGLISPGAFGVSFDAELRLGRIFSIAAGAVLFPGHSVTLPPGTVDVELTTGFARGCVAVVGENASLNLRLCADAWGGALSGAGNGYSVDRTSVRPWGAAGAAAGARIPLVGPVALALRGGILVPFRRETFVVDNVGTAFEAPPVAGILDAGLHLTIW